MCTIPALVVGVLSTEFDWTKAGQKPVADAVWQTALELVTTFIAGMPVVSFLSLAYRRLIEFRDIVLQGEKLGTIYVESDLQRLDARFREYSVARSRRWR